MIFTVESTRDEMWLVVIMMIWNQKIETEYSDLNRIVLSIRRDLNSNVIGMSSLIEPIHILVLQNRLWILTKIIIVFDKS